MNKHKNLTKFLKKFDHFINSLIIKKSKKLNFYEKKISLAQFIDSRRVFLAIFTLIILTFTYLSIPNFYDKSKIQDLIQNQVFERYNVKFHFSSDIQYNVFPWPNYTFKNVKISNQEIKLGDIGKLRLKLNINNFFLLENLRIKEILLKDTKFNIDKKNINFFLNLLNYNFADISIKILDSYIFFKKNDNEILLINKVNEMSYYYDDYISQNILKVENEIFNIPYNLEIYKDKNKKKIFSKVKINTLKSIVQNEYDYSKNRKVGFVNITNNKDKSKINFNIDKGKLTFQFLDEMRESNFNYDGEIYFKPFFMNLNGNLRKLNIDYLSDINSLLIQLLKSEVFNNQNLNFSSNINAEKILSNHKFKDLLINFKIKEGLIDVDNSNFNWSDFANFKITNSLIFIEENTLVLDGTMSIEIKNYNEIYKFFQTPRNYRKEINKLNFNFNYNFDQETLNISDIKINNQENYKVGNIINKLVSQENMLQNRIYLKNLINRAIKAYSG